MELILKDSYCMPEVRIQLDNGLHQYVSLKLSNRNVVITVVEESICEGNFLIVLLA